MSQQRWTEVDRYITDLLVPGDPSLEAALRDAAAAGLPPHDVSPNQGKLLHLLARAQGARTILEIGTLGGYSTIWLARALPPGGRLVTLEADPKHAGVARANIARAGLADVVEVLVGPALDTLPQLAAEGRGPFDLVFIDADKPSNPEYLVWALRLSRPGTLIIADNVVRDGRVTDASSDDPSVRGIRRFNELLAAEPRVSATAVQTVGSKGYDGFAVALVTAVDQPGVGAVRPPGVVGASTPTADVAMADLGSEFLADQRRRLAETRARMDGVVRQLSDEDVNWRANPQSNSVTNLVLHVSGNLVQRYAATIGGGADVRDREAEFCPSARRSVGELLRLITESFGEADRVHARMRPEDLLRVTHVRGKPRTVLDVIATSTEHSAEHLGQIIYIAKARLGERYRYLWTP